MTVKEFGDYYGSDRFDIDSKLVTTLNGKDVTVNQLLNFYEDNEDNFKQTFILLVKRNVIITITTAVKIKIIAVCIVKRDHVFMEWCLQHKKFFGIAEVSKALRLCDAPRKIRQMRAKLENINKRYGITNDESNEPPNPYRRRGRGGRRGRGRQHNDRNSERNDKEKGDKDSKPKKKNSSWKN
eukprot:UN24857